MIEHIPNLPEGVVGTMVAWLTHRVYTIESRLDAIAAAVGAPPPKKTGKHWKMLLVIGGVWLACSLSGCTSISQRARTMETAPDGTQILRESRNRMVSTGSAKTIADKLKVAAGKTATVGADGIEGTSTNDSAQTLDSLTRLLQAIPKH